MASWHRYDAYIVPGLGDLDRDEGLRLGLSWLQNRSDEAYRRAGVIVLDAVKMVRNAPILGVAAQRFTVVSPRAPGHYEGGPVLAVWPSERALDLAEELAMDLALCVIPGNPEHLRAWILARQPAVVGDHAVAVPELSVPAEVEATLQDIDQFDGSNDFVMFGKAEAIKGLRALHRKGLLEPVQVQAWLLAHGECSSEGARRMRTWAKEVLDGRRHRLR